MSTKTRFEKEAKGHSEIVYFRLTRSQVTNPQKLHLIARVSNLNLSRIVVLVIQYAYRATF